MVFKLDSRHDLTEQFRGMACKRLDQALAALRTRSRSARSLDTAVHKARKRIREVRALLRLMRAPMGEKAFKRENRALRDACRPLSAVRDATALIEAFKTLQAEAGVNAPLETFESTRKALRKRRQDLRRRALQQAETLEHSAAAVEKVRDRLKSRKLKHATRKTLKTALRRSCKQAQSAMAAALQDGDEQAAEQTFATLPDISIDYALMEKAKQVLMTRANFAWDDVGAWDALDRGWPRDAQGNVVVGDPVLIDVKNSVVYNEPGAERMAVSVIGVEGLAVVVSADGVLIVPKDRVQDVKKAVKEMKARGATQL